MSSKILILVSAICLSGLSLQSFAQNVKASVFCETFDGTGDIGGNDGFFSDYGAISFPIRFDNAGWTQQSISGGSECIRLGKSSGSSASSITTPDIVVKAGDLTLTFDAGLWKKSKAAKMNIKRSLDGSNSSWTGVTVTNGAFSTIQKQFTAKADGTLNLTFDNKASSSKYSYFFIDNIIVYQDNASDEQQQKAQRIILSGNFTADNVQTLNQNLSQNFDVVSIDAREAVLPSGSTLTPANKNCIIYAVASSNVSNHENVVIDGICLNFNLYDGDKTVSYPFYADEDFTAENASYDRDFSSAAAGGYYSSVCLPFHFDTSAGIKTIYQCTDYKNPVLEFTAATGVDGNTPALIAVTEAQPFLSLKNVAVKKTSAKGSCFQSAASAYGVYRFHDDIISDAKTNSSAFGYSGGKFLKITQTGYFKPFRVFFSIMNVSLSSSSSLSASFKFPEGIRTIATDGESDHTVYSIDGRTVQGNNVSSGIYIVGHKKIYIKR
jgi:hypothetical protein